MLFELDKYDRNLHKLQPAVPEHDYQPASGIEKASLVYWAEHCVECAAPACFQSCDLYQPRTDTRCRRFTFGAFKNKNFRSVRGYGVEIAFKKWAKMEAYGNLRLLSTRDLRRWERFVEWSSPTGNVVGKLMARMTGTTRWKALVNEALEALMRRLDRKRPGGSDADAFLLEIYNPTNDVVRMQLSFSAIPQHGDSKNALAQLSKTFTTTVVFQRGYSRYEIEIALLGRSIDLKAPFVVRMIPESDNEARLVFLSAEFVKFAKKLERCETRKIKCVVFDLDNTLWKGVLVEGDAVAVEPETVDVLRHLDEKGILLSIASKNDYEVAWRRLEELGLSEYFLYPQINWNPKSQSVKTIAERLNIGIDALAFVDDNPFELDEVARANPEVQCMNASQIGSLISDARFAGTATPDARRRRQLYREAETREAAQESFGSDYLGFLASCEIRLEISTFAPGDEERVAELVQRTNQLNFSGQKRTRRALEEILREENLDKYVLKCSDRYGYYGTIGFCIAESKPDAILIHDLMLSCRVQGKLLEKAFLGHLFAAHNPEGAQRLWVNFRPSARNKPAQQVLESLQFRACGQEMNGSSGMELGHPEALKDDLAIVRVHCNCLTRTFASESALNSTL